MERYADWAPTAFDRRGAFLDEDRDNWLVLPVIQTRDSGPLYRSNFEVAQRSLAEVDPEENDHECHRFGHWGPGWFEILIVRPDTAAAADAAEMESALADYPVLDEMSLSELELDEAIETWQNASMNYRVEMCRRAGVSIFAARRNELPDSTDLIALLGEC